MPMLILPNIKASGTLLSTIFFILKDPWPAGSHVHKVLNKQSHGHTDSH
jgi:hypothetical protein